MSPRSRFICLVWLPFFIVMFLMGRSPVLVIVAVAVIVSPAGVCVGYVTVNVAFSSSVMRGWFVEHGVQGPPQSTPSSPWFCLLSAQLMQGLQGPPQSIPCSSWFSMWSSQVGLVHGVQGPPQSMSSSPWFCLLSEHVGQGAQGPPQSIPCSSWFRMLS